MDNLDKIQQSITDSIDKVFNLPDIKVDGFSTQNLKKEIIPLLKDAEKRIYDIGVINSNINGIRNEIIDPVNASIKEKSKKSNWLAMIGIVSGLIGLILTLHSFLFPKTMLSNETLTKIEKINANLVDEQVVLKARELIKYKKEPKYEQKILLTYKTEDGQNAMEEYYNYLQGIGYKNISKMSPDAISYFNSSANNTIPYIYYRTRDINNDIINGLEKLSKHYHSSRYGNIIALMYYEQSTERYVKWIFNENRYARWRLNENVDMLMDIELLIVL